MPATELALLEAAAREAGALALARVGAPGAVRHKPEDGGPVSEADLAVDALLRARLGAARPDYGWLSEESEDGPARLEAARVFVVDPIDGTRAFLAGQAAWAISVAVVEAGRPIAGVVHLPAMAHTYSAAIGRGATRDGGAIAASARTGLDGATLLASGNQMLPGLWPGGTPVVERHFRPSIAYRLCLVAEGRFDATITFRASWEWDLAAGDLIAQEAGARVTDRTGQALAYNRPSPLLPGVIAAAPGVHAALLARAVG